MSVLRLTVGVLKTNFQLWIVCQNGLGEFGEHVTGAGSGRKSV